MSEHVLSILVKAIGAQSAAKDLKGVDAAVSNLGGRAGKGLHTFGSNLKSAFTTPLGLIGITGGLFGLEHILSSSITKAQEMGATVSKMSKITGLGAVGVSKLSAALEHFGVDSETQIKLVGMLEKNVGNLTKGVTDNAGSIKSVAQFQKTYGLAIVDANGHVKDANELILTSADYFNNKTIPAQTKAAGLAKLYGRNWQALVPILSAGRQGIKDVEEEAQRLGLTLTTDNIDALRKSREATRSWNTALGGLELQIGLKLLPAITDLATTATGFVSAHGKEIINFFGDAAKFAGDMGGAIHDNVLPVIKGIGDAWGGLPPELKKLLITGFVVNKLSGGAITGIAGELGKGLIKGVLGMNAGVVNIKAGVVTGGGGGVAGAAGGGIASLLPATLVAGAIVAAAVPIGQAFADALPPELKGPGGKGKSESQTRIEAAHALQAAASPASGGLSPDDRQTLRDQTQKLQAIKDADLSIAGYAKGTISALTHVETALHRDLVSLNRASTPAAIAAAAKRVAADVTKGAGSVGHTGNVLAELKKQFSNTHDPKLQAVLRTAIGQVQSKLPNREWVQKQITDADRILSSSESQKQKLIDLTAIQRTLRDRGDTHAAAIIGRRIDAKKMAVTVHGSPITVVNTVSVADVIKSRTTFKKAGNVYAI